MDDRHEPSVRVAIERREDQAVRDGTTMLGLQLDYVDAVAPGELGYPGAEEAGVGDNDRLPRRDQIDDSGLHRGGPGARQGEHERVLGRPPRVTQQLDRVEQQLVQIGVEVAEHRPLHRGDHARVGVGGAGAGEQPRRRIEWGGVHRPSLADRGCEYNLRISSIPLRIV